MYQNLFNAFRKIEFNPTDDEKSVSFFYNEGRKKYWIELYLIPSEFGKEKNVCIDFGKEGKGSYQRKNKHHDRGNPGHGYFFLLNKSTYNFYV